MPVQYIIGEWDFRRLTLKMQPPVFIPRPETEELIEIILKVDKNPKNVLDLCCGSGAIALALLQETSQSEVTAVDQSEIACSLTMENAQKHGLHKRIRVIRSPIRCLQNVINGEFDLIVSNPPYIFTQDLDKLQPEVILYEARQALDGGIDGMDVIKQVLEISSSMLSKNGNLFLELDPRHPLLLKSHLQDNPKLGLYIAQIFKDFCLKDRFVQINKTSD